MAITIIPRNNGSAKVTNIQRVQPMQQQPALKPGPYSQDFLIKQSLKTQGNNSPIVKQIKEYTGMSDAEAGIYALTMGDKSSMGKAAGKVLEDVAIKAHPKSQFAKYKQYEDYQATVDKTLSGIKLTDYNAVISKLENEIKALKTQKDDYDKYKNSHMYSDSAYSKNPAAGTNIDDVVKKIGYLKTALRQYKDKKDLKPYEDEALKVNDWRTTTYIPAAETTNDNLNNVKLFLDWAHGYKKGEYIDPNGAKTTYNLDNSYHEDFGGWENATDEQIKTLTYWYNTDRSKANKYFESVSKKWLEERSYKLAEQASKDYENASGAKKFWYGVKDFFGIEKLPSSVLAFTSEIVQLVADGEVSPYTPAFDALTKGNTINAEIMSDMNPFLKFVYSAGSSTVQNVIGAATLGEVGYLASMGLQAQTTSYKQYIDSGADPDAALITSGIIGTVEILSEKVGLETWLKGFDTKTAETFIKSWIKSMGYEASEEVFSSIAGKFAESVVMGSDAPDEVEIRRLMTEEGLTYERAKEKVTLDNIKDTVYEAVVAAVSAGLSGGTVTLNSTVSNKLSERRFNNAIGQRIFENNNVDSLVDEAQNTLKNAEQNPDGIELSETTKKAIKNLKESIELLKDSNNKKYTRNIGQLFANHLDLVSSLSHDSKVSTIKPAVMNAMQNIGIDAALTDEALDIIWRKVSFGTSEVYTEEQDILDEIGGERLLNELISDNDLAAKVTAQNFLDGAISGQFNNIIQGRVDRTEPNTEQSSEANLPNTSENVKENTPSPLTLTEPDGREIVDMPTYKEATEDAVRKMNGLTVKTGTQKHIDKLAGSLKSVSNVAWDESVPVGEGRYNPETKTITLNPNSSVTQNYAYLFKHEFTHSLEGKAKFNQFVTWLFDKSKSFDAFVNMIAERNGIEFTEDMSPEQKQDAVINHYVEEYSSEYGNLSPETQREYAKIEMVADYVGGFLFTGESYEVNAKSLAIGDFSQDTEASLNAIEEIANEDKSFIRMIIDFIKDLRNKINLALGKSGKTVAEDLKRAEQYLETVYKSADTKVDSETSNDVKYSKSYKTSRHHGSYYNEFNTLAMQWAYNSKTKPGDMKILFRGNGAVLLMADEENGYTELSSGKYSEVKNRYDRYVQEQANRPDDAIEIIRTGKRYYNRHSGFSEFGRRDTENGRLAGSQGLQNNSGRNRTDMLRSDKGLSQSTSGQKNNTELNEASDEGASSVSTTEKFSKGVPVEDQTKTESFKRWFGESKTVNKDGIPKVFYHGTNEQFTAFDKSKAKSSGLYGRGFYFTESESQAQTYGNNMAVYLSIKNPLSPGNSKITREQITKFLSAVAENEDYSIENYGTYDVEAIAKKITSDDAFSVIQDINATAIGDFAEAIELFNEVNGTNFDGIITPTETVVFEPTQIKSATDNIGTFDSDNPDIRYSKGIPVPTLRYNTEEFAKSLIRKARSTIEVEDVTEQLKEIVKAYNKFNTDTADKLISKLTLEIAEYQKPVREYYAQEYLDNLKGETVRVFKEDMGDIDFAGDTLKGLKESTGIKFVISESEAREWLSESKGEKITSNTAFKNLCREYGLVIDNDGKYSGLDNLSEIGADINEDSTDMSPIEQLKNRYDQMTNAYEPVDEAGLAEYLAKDIYDQLENTGARAENKRITQARREGVAKGEGFLNEYKEKQKRQRDAALVATRMRDLQKKTDRLLKSFERRLVKPTRASHIPSDLIGNCIAALRVVQENPVLQDDVAIGSKYAPELEMLNQRIQNELDRKERDKLILRYAEKLKTATDVAGKIKDIIDVYSKYENDEKYAAIYSEDMVEMLANLTDVIGETEPHNYDEYQLRTVFNTFSMLDTLIKNEDKLVAAEINSKASSAASQLIEEFRRANKMNPKLVEKYLSATNDPLRFFRRIGNYDENSMSMKLYKMLNDGAHKAMRYQMDAEKIFSNLLNTKDNVEKSRGLSSIKNKDLVDSGLVDENGQKIMITKAMRISLLMHSFNEQNMRHIMAGVTVPNLDKYYRKITEDGSIRVDEVRGWVNGDINTWQINLANEMSDYELQWVKALQEYYYLYSAGKLNEVSLDLYGFEKAVVNNYFPIVSDPDFLKKPSDDIKFDFSLKAMGFIQDRKNASNPLLLLDAINQVQSNIKQHARFYGMAIPMENFNKVYNFTATEYGTSVKKELSYAFGKEIDKKTGAKKGTTSGFEIGRAYVDKLISDIYGGTVAEGGLLNKIRSNNAAAILSLNIGVALKQAASYPTAAAVLGWKPLMKALAVIEKNGGKKGFVLSRAEVDTINKYTELLWNRSQGNFATQIYDIQDKSIGGKLAKKAPLLLNMIQKIDNATVGRLWYSSKYYVDDNFKSLTKDSDAYYKKVAEIFNKVVEETQPNYDVLHRPGVLRSNNSVVRALTMFSTQRLQNINIVLDSLLSLRAAVVGHKNGTISKSQVNAAIRTVGRAASSQLIASIVLSTMDLLSKALFKGFKGYRDDDDEVTALSLIGGYLDTFLSTLVGSALFGAELYAVAKVFAGKGKWFDMDVPEISLLNKGISAICSLAEWLNKEEEKRTPEAAIKALIKVAETAGGVIGVPLENAKNLGLGIYYDVKDMIDGEAFRTAIKDNKVNEFFGQYIQSKSHKYTVMYKALQDGDTEKAEKYYNELVKSGTENKDINTGLLKVFKEDEKVKQQTSSAVKKLKGNKSYQSFDDMSKEAVQKGIENYFAKKAMEKVFGHTSESYKKTVKNTDKVVNQGVSIDIYLVAKEMFKKKYADTDKSGGVSKAEKYEAIDNLDTSENVKSVLYDELIK